MEEFLQNREKLINDWIDAAINIKDQFGIAKATGYLVGEKFYNLLIELKYLRKYHNDKPEMVDGLQALILKCSEKIRAIFTEEEIHDYFESNPVFGALGHVSTEETHKLFVERGVVEHTLETEIEDALLIGVMN